MRTDTSLRRLGLLRADRLALAGLFLWSASCKQVIPSHLARVPDEPSSEQAAAPASVTSHEDAVRLVVGRDPLARRTAVADPHIFDDVEGAESLRRVLLELRRSEIVQGDTTATVQVMAPRFRGSEATAVLRGYRLQLADRLLGIVANTPQDPSSAELSPLLTRLRPADASFQTARHPLEFLAGDGSLVEALRRYGDRWTMLGWLESPSTPLQPVAEALDATPYDALRGSKLGRLITQRARGSEASYSQALQDLRLATDLSLQRVAADRDREQAAWADTKAAQREALGTSSPIPFLLDRALEGFIAGAGADEAVGAALVALTALRWTDACDWDPCSGLDRIDSLNAVSSWSSSLQKEVEVWRVIALKDGLDAMDVGHNTVVFPRALVSLVDALLGTGATPVTADILARRRGEPAVWNALGESIGKAVTPTWNDVRVALGAHLREIAEQAARDTEGSRKEWLERIARRAIP